MPTPFSHIVLSEQVLASPRLPAAARRVLTEKRAAFLLGSTAPDAGGLAGLARQATHFFDVPMLNRSPAHLRLLAQHQQLAQPERLAPAHAAFMAGYLSHLWLDQLWIAMVFQPAFGRRPFGDGFHQRLIEHNLLRAHLDRADQTALPAGLNNLLAEAAPRQWLPFLTDEAVLAWRDHLAEQVADDGQIRTLEVFAGRLGMPTDAFAHQLDSPHMVERIIDERLPSGALERFRLWGLAGAIELVDHYLQGSVRSAPTTTRLMPKPPSGPQPSWDGNESHRAL